MNPKIRFINALCLTLRNAQPHLLKTIFYITVIIFLASCHASSDKDIFSPDSLQYAAYKTKGLSKEEFEHYYNSIKYFFDSTLFNKDFNGGFLVAKNGTIVFEQYMGYKDLRTKDPLTCQTSIHIASTTKTFTGMAILQLIEEGKVKLEDSLTSFFPEIAYKGITIKMLLNHRSGLPNYLYYFEKNKWDKKQFVTNRDVLQSLYIFQPGITFKPDTRFNYSNTNYVLLALIIEKITGLSYFDYLRKKFFDPLNMKNTFVYSRNDSAIATPSFDWNANYWQLDCFDLTYGDKNIYSTPRDLLKWDQALYKGQLISNDLLNLAFTPYSNETQSIHNYGLGWRLLMLPNGKKLIYHHGRWHGFNAMFARLIDENATIIILGNKFNKNIYHARKMYDIFGDYQQNIIDAGAEEVGPENSNKEKIKLQVLKTVTPATSNPRKK